MSATFVVCGIFSSFGNTYFIEQANLLNRELGKLKVPLQVLLLFGKMAKKFFFTPRAKCLLKSNSIYRPSIGIAVAMAFSIMCCIAAAIMEQNRLEVIERNGLLNKPESKIPMSVFWLLFQFFLLAGLDTFFEASVDKFYRDQSPGCMSRYLICFAKGVSGLGFMCNVLLAHVVGVISEKGGRKGWFQSTLSLSRLDKYYWLLSGLSTVNLAVYALVACTYRYKTPDESHEETALSGGGTTAIPPDENGSNQCCFLFG